MPSNTPKLDAALDALIPKLKQLEETIGAIGYDVPLTPHAIRAMTFRSRIRLTLIELETRKCSTQS